MKAYRDDVRARAVAHGRNPDDIKVMFVVTPTLGATDREARERRAEREAAEVENVELQLVHMAATQEIDMSPYAWDEPLPTDITTNGHQSMLKLFLDGNKGKTLREAAARWRTRRSVELVGTPDTVAAQMDEVMQEVGGDGFLISDNPVTRRYINEICDGLAPALRRRGLIRDGYDHKLFRDNLLAF
jgi:alkanesulfonate monooxygenase SsuD/methylene tetrahydromethanopterin reductase-like flavin-dependent oxidoreductase (luciferase family)